jgi:uncharacterized membrane protein YbhN (UPF0104 family)
MPEIVDQSQLILSLFILILAMVSGCLPWHQLLRSKIPGISFKRSLKSMGLYVFSKYMPGKVWVILGRASYMADRSELSLARLSYYSMHNQIIGLWYGLITGIIGLGVLAPQSPWIIIGIIIIMAMAFVLFIPTFTNLTQSLLQKILKRKIQLPQFGIKEVLLMGPSYLVYWLGIALSLYFLGGALFDQGISIAAALCFNLAAVLGVIALVAPGGLGVREGFLAACLIMGGTNPVDAATFSVATRLWFLSGEFSHFIIALLIKDPADA